MYIGGFPTGAIVGIGVGAAVIVIVILIIFIIVGCLIWHKSKGEKGQLYSLM